MIMLRMALRELWRARIRFALLLLVLSVQVMAVGGTYVSLASFERTRDHYYDKLDFADLELGFSPAAETELPSLEALRKIPGVRGVARTFVTRGTIEDGKSAPWPVVVVYLDPGTPEVNAIATLSGHGLDANAPNGAMVDRSFAETRSVRIGDAVTVNPHRFATRFTVVGVGLSPEFLIPAVDPSFAMPAKGSLGVLYASRAELDRLFLEHLYNHLAFTFEPGADLDATRKNIVAALPGLALEEVVPRRANLGYRLLDDTLRAPRVLTPIMSIVVGLLAAIVAYVIMARIIADQRREIGALLAMGFPWWHFMVGYALLGLAPGVLGATVGLALARPFGRFITENEAAVLGFPQPMIASPYGMLAASVTVAVLVSLIGALVPVLSIVRMAPALAMRGGHEIVFRGLGRAQWLSELSERLVAHCRPSTRYALRNVFRRVRLSLAAVLLVSSGVAAPASLLTMTSSWETWSEQTSAKLHWDATVRFRVPLALGALEPIMSRPGLREIETFVDGRAALSRAGTSEQDVFVRGLAVPSRLDPRGLTAGTGFSSEDALEVVLHERMLRTGPAVRMGETVRLASSHGTTLDLRIVGVANDASTSTVNLPRRTAQRLLGLGERVSGMFVLYGARARAEVASPGLPAAGPRPDGSETIDIASAELDAASTGSTPETASLSPGDLLLREEMVVGLQSRGDAARTIHAYTHAQHTAIRPFLIVGVFLALIAIVSVLAILLLERESEYATLRAMGYGPVSILRTVFAEVTALSITGLSTGLLVWLALSKYLQGELTRDFFEIPLDYRLGDFLTLAGPMALFLAFATLAGVRWILRINLREALCARAIS